MKIKLKPEIFRNKWADSFLKALQGSETTTRHIRFVAGASTCFVVRKCDPFDYDHDIFGQAQIIFDVKDLEIDWACLIHEIHFNARVECCSFSQFGEVTSRSMESDTINPNNYNNPKTKLDLEWLNEQEGVKVFE